MSIYSVISFLLVVVAFKNIERGNQIYSLKHNDNEQQTTIQIITTTIHNHNSVNPQTKKS